MGLVQPPTSKSVVNLSTVSWVHLQVEKVNEWILGSCSFGGAKLPYTKDEKKHTLPETNMVHLKITPWKRNPSSSLRLLSLGAAGGCCWGEGPRQTTSGVRPLWRLPPAAPCEGGRSSSSMAPSPGTPVGSERPRQRSHSPRPARPPPQAQQMQVDDGGGRPCRVFCPVPTCPCHDTLRHRGWATAASMQAHVDAHLAGTLQGEVPAEWGSMPTTAQDAWYAALVLRPTEGCTRPVGQPTAPLQATNLLTTQWEGRLSRPLLTYKLVGPAPFATSLLLLRVSGPAPFPVL